MGVLTISRQYGSGGKEIGKAVAHLLGYEYIDRGRILDDMRKAGTKWEERAKYYDENHPDVWERHEWSFRGFVALNQYHILAYAIQDKTVIMGRGGACLLGGVPFVLKVRTEAPLEKRIEKVMKWEETNAENARWLIEKADKEMAGAIYVIYGKRWDDPRLYEMVFNTGLLDQDEIINAIRNQLIKREQFNTEKARKILQMKVLAAKIKAEIAIDPTLSISTLDVEMKEEGLTQYGLVVRSAVYNREDLDRIKEVARRIAGDVPLEFELHFRWPPRFKS
jgi:cytidylate kinase